MRCESELVLCICKRGFRCDFYAREKKNARIYRGLNDGLPLKLSSREIEGNFSDLSTGIRCNEKNGRTSEFLREIEDQSSFG